MKLKSILLAAAIAILALVSPAYSADAQGAANVQLIKSFLHNVREAMAARDPAKIRAVAERYMAEDYVQHAKGMPPGREGFVEGLSHAPAGGARPAPKDLYFFGDGEYVIWVSEGMEPGKVLFNMVRVVNGKMKEHWDSN
jgi:predicted SnoaL-like aldol condensation-catalyzing enzyme